MIVWIVYIETIDANCNHLDVSAVFADIDLAKAYMEQATRKTHRGIANIPITFENLGGGDLTPTYTKAGEVIYGDCYAVAHEVIGAQL
jgi:hypothetical protein